MLKFEKMREYMHGKLGCKIFEMFELNGVLEYVRFQTQTGVYCLLKIDRHMTYPTDHSKLVHLMDSPNPTEDQGDFFVMDDLTLVKKVSPSISGEGYVKFIARLNPSLSSTIYSLAVVTPENLIVGDKVFLTKSTITSSPQMLIVLNLKTVVERNVNFETKRVYDNVVDIITESTDKFKNQLKKVLTECSEMRILSDKMSKIDTANLVEKNIFLVEAQRALKLAVEAVEAFTSAKKKILI